MKTAIKAFDLICAIWAGVFIVGTIVYLCIYPVITDLVQQNIDTLPQWLVDWVKPYESAGKIVSAVYNLCQYSAALVLAIIGTVKVYGEDKTRVPHIFLIVAGALCACPFGIVGGILGLVDLHNEEKNQLIAKEPEEQSVVEIENKDEE